MESTTQVLSNPQFLAVHVFAKAGPRAHLFVPLLRQRAQEGYIVHGKKFSLQDVEEAVKLAGLDVPSSSKGTRPTPLPESRVPTPARAAPHRSLSLTSPDMQSETSTTSPTASTKEQALRKPSAGELLQHASSSAGLGQETSTEVTEEKVSLCLRGSRMEIRANPPRLSAATPRPPEGGVVVDVLEEEEEDEDRAPGEPPKKKRRPDGAVSLSQGERRPDVELGRFGVPRLLTTATVPQQTLRISAGRAAAAAGIHPYQDVGDLFLEFVYQDLPDLLLHDAELVGAEVVSPALERAQLLAKSGEEAGLQAALRSAASSLWVQGVHDAKSAVGQLAAGAEKAGRLTSEEADELRNMLELEMNLEFGARHEDEAIAVYSQRVGQEVYGQQRRVSLGMPEGGPQEALAAALPPRRSEPLPREEVAEQKEKKPSSAYFRLTGFVDGLVDLPAPAGSGGTGLETLVVEVKHRIGKIKDPPNLYDVVQLCSYCRVFGLSRGHLVQCLRETSPSDPKGKLHITTLDFNEGSMDRKGWDEHVLPALYKVAAAVYATRNDTEVRLQLLAAATPEARVALVGRVCPHLER